MATTTSKSPTRWVPAAFALTAVFQVAAAELPPLKEQIDATVHALGNGGCETHRRGVWLVDGGVVVEIDKPKGSCNFTLLHLTVEGDAIPHTAIDDSFFCNRHFYTREQVCEWYRGKSGKIFFATDKKIDPTKIQGISEPKCTSYACLNEVPEK